MSTLRSHFKTLQSIDFHYQQDDVASLKARLNCASATELTDSPDAILIADWLEDGAEDLCIWPTQAA